jgi:Fic family protein
MAWLWQQKDWPTFTFDASKYQVQEDVFYTNSGRVSGSIEHLELEQGETFKINVLCQEAVATSIIEGELLDRDSVQSSIRKHMGLKTDHRRASAAEAGVAEMHVDVYSRYAEPLTHDMMHGWHAMLTNGRRDLVDVGRYRTHAEPMQVISGSYSKPKVYYEAPPSAMVPYEMERYVDWFNTAVNDRSTPVLTTAAVAHLYFEMIHPYEDGNGRIGRALVEKVLSTRLGGPSLNSFSRVIELNKKSYYTCLQQCNTTNQVDQFVHLFTDMVLASQDYTYHMVRLLIHKSKVMKTYADELNARQEKLLLRLYDVAQEGFEGGMSAKKYTAMTKASPSSATRDLQHLADLGILYKTGQLKGTRYHLVGPDGLRL